MNFQSYKMHKRELQNNLKVIQQCTHLFQNGMVIFVVPVDV